jgi:hypothetical protein
VPDRPRDVDKYGWEFLQTLERRRNQSDTIAWTVPALAVAAEAFLLTIVLRPETQDAGRFVASVAGVFMLAAALHLLWKSVFNFDLWDSHINDQRQKLHLHGLRTRDDLFPATKTFPDKEQIRVRKYEERWRVKHWLGFSQPASRTWIWAVQLLLLLNLLLALYSFLEWVGVIDWNWFGPDKGARSPLDEHIRGLFQDD